MDSSICSDCRGRGTWGEQTMTKDGLVQIVQRFCATCNGTGIVESTNDDFDIQGDDDDD